MLQCNWYLIKGTAPFGPGSVPVVTQCTKRATWAVWKKNLKGCDGFHYNYCDDHVMMFAARVHKAYGRDEVCGERIP